MRFRKPAIALAAVLGLMATSTNAFAAADVSVGGSCKVSANWTVTTSVNFDNTSGSPSTGSVDYAVMSSPNFMATDINNSYIQVFAGNGALLSVNFGNWVRDTSKSGYVYRTDATSANVNVRRVLVNPMTSTGISGVRCSEYSSAVNHYSVN